MGPEDQEGIGAVHQGGTGQGSNRPRNQRARGPGNLGNKVPGLQGPGPHRDQGIKGPGEQGGRGPGGHRGQGAEEQRGEDQRPRDQGAIRGKGSGGSGDQGARGGQWNQRTNQGQRAKEPEGQGIMGTMGPRNQKTMGPGIGAIISQNLVAIDPCCSCPCQPIRLTAPSTNRVPALHEIVCPLQTQMLLVGYHFLAGVFGRLGCWNCFEQIQEPHIFNVIELLLLVMQAGPHLIPISSLPLPLRRRRCGGVAARRHGAAAVTGRPAIFDAGGRGIFGIHVEAQRHGQHGGATSNI